MRHNSLIGYLNCHVIRNMVTITACTVPYKIFNTQSTECFIKGSDNRTSIVANDMQDRLKNDECCRYSLFPGLPSLTIVSHARRKSKDTL